MNENSKLIFKAVKENVTIEEIAALESKLKISLPKEYKDHILQYNGGYPDRECFITVDGIRSRIHYFYAIYNGEHINFETFFIMYKIDDNRMLRHIFPIAIDPGGNQICISTDEKDYGHIYFWDHEAETNIPSYSNMSLIAQSFNEFLDALFVCPE